MATEAKYKTFKLGADSMILDDSIDMFALGLDDLANNSVTDAEGNGPTEEIIESITRKAFNDAARVLQADLNAYLQDLDQTEEDDPEFRENIRKRMKWVGS